MNNISVERNYNFLRNFFSKIGYNIDIRKLSKESFPKHIPADFVEVLKSVRDRTIVPWEGLFLNWQAAMHIVNNKIEGDIVECGVWRGGSMILIGEYLSRHGGLSKRKFWLYDTFSGMPKPGDEDVSQIGPAKDDWLSSRQADSDDGSTWCYADIDDVKQGLAKHFESHLPFHFVKGKVEDTLLGEKPEKIALLRLDTDFYESTKLELEQLYPRLVKGGVLILDDYHFWQGARKAAEEYFSTLKEKPFFVTEPHSGRVLILK